MLKYVLAFLLASTAAQAASVDTVDESNYVRVKIGRTESRVECNSDAACFLAWRNLGCRPAAGNDDTCRPYRKGQKLVRVDKLPETFPGCDTDSDCADKVSAIGCHVVGNFLTPNAYLCWRPRK